MPKWGDYGISAVRFNSAHTHIDRVLVHLDNGETVGAGSEYARADIVSSIKNVTCPPFLVQG